LSSKEKDRKNIMKKIIRELHEGKTVDEVKGEFKNILNNVTPTEISQVEEELIKEGVKIDEIRKLCDVHLAIFQETLEKEKPSVPDGHPINILLEEHKKILEFSNELYSISKKMAEHSDKVKHSQDIEIINNILEHFKGSEKHYQREENVLFPYLEKHGVTQPPKIMWMEHDSIRETEKKLYGLVEKSKGFSTDEKFRKVSLAMVELVSNHFYKENNVLFSTALNLIEDEEWIDIREQFDEIGFCCFTPESATVSYLKPETQVKGPLFNDVISFETGDLSKKEINNILNTIPFDVTFIDKNDRVRYFSNGKDRIFIRSKAIIGRSVQQCHPQKSLHKVENILKEFKKGKRDSAEFWINLNKRLIHIRYFAVRNNIGEYIGTLEVTQDITDIKEIQGEKRLLDWK